ncbi:MAG TPA: nitroreductase family protein [Methylophilaceae bacterium]|nr:nitroreductase family protein [Methylophilaceae bacterium]
MKKPAITRVPIEDTLANRWSGRAYDASKPMSEQQIIALLEAARWAPSCYGDQPWRFIVWNRNADAASWEKAFDCLAPGNQGWVKDAPVLLLSAADSIFNHNGTPNRWGQYDTGAAAENLCLQAASMGLMAHQMGGFDVEKTRSTFSIPEQYALMAMIAVGYPADIATLQGEVLEREQAPRKRHELGKLFFKGGWGQPII